MRTKTNIFFNTFIVLSIICCFLIAITYLMRDSVDIKSNIFYSSPSEVKGISTLNNTSGSSNSPSLSENSSVNNKNTSNDNSNLLTEKTPVNNSANTLEKSESTQKEIVQAPSLTITAVGDIMAHQSNLNNAYNPKTKTYDFNGFLEYVKPYLSKSDLTIGNFETVTAGSGFKYTSYPRFNTPDAIITALSNSGFDVLSTANNHCLDMGLNGLKRTIKNINNNKMINVGSSVDGKNKYTTKEINGIKVSILSYTYAFNGNDSSLTSKQKSTYLSHVNETQIKKDITTVKSQGTDAVIVIIHWGTEYQRTPNSTQTSLSKKLLSWGADIILGSHPHVIQKSDIEKVNGKNKFVIYSMGNFISGYRRTDTAKRPNKIYTEDGVIVQLKIEKDPKGGIILKNVDYIPTWVDKTYVNNRPVYKIIPIPNANTNESYITNKNRAFVKQSYKNTMSIMEKLN